MTVISDTLAALPDEFTRARVIWEKMNCWSPVGVRQALNVLCDRGDAGRTPDEKASAWCRPHLYRKARK